MVYEELDLPLPGDGGCNGLEAHRWHTVALRSTSSISDISVDQSWIAILLETQGARAAVVVEVCFMNVFFGLFGNVGGIKNFVKNPAYLKSVGGKS